MLGFDFHIFRVCPPSLMPSYLQTVLYASWSCAPSCKPSFRSLCPVFHGPASVLHSTLCPSRTQSFATRDLSFVNSAGSITQVWFRLQHGQSYIGVANHNLHSTIFRLSPPCVRHQINLSHVCHFAVDFRSRCFVGRVYICVAHCVLGFSSRFTHIMIPTK